MPKRALLAALLLLITLILSVTFVVTFLDSPADQSAAAPPFSSDRLPIALTTVPEADEVLASISANYPNVVPHSGKPVLVRLHQGVQLNRNGAGGKGPMPGAYSPIVQWCKPNGGIGFWGIYEEWASGSYIAVYRLRPLDGWNGSESCTVEIQSNAGNKLVASYVPKPSELKAGEWVDIPVAFTLAQKTQIEFRFWAGANGFAIDRIFLFRLP